MRKLPVTLVGVFTSTPGMNHTQHSLHSDKFISYYAINPQQGYVRKLPVTLVGFSPVLLV